MDLDPIGLIIPGTKLLVLDFIILCYRLALQEGIRIECKKSYLPEPVVEAVCIHSTVPCSFSIIYDRTKSEISFINLQHNHEFNRLEQVKNRLDIQHVLNSYLRVKIERGEVNKLVEERAVVESSLSEVSESEEEVELNGRPIESSSEEEEEEDEESVEPISRSTRPAESSSEEESASLKRKIPRKRMSPRRPSQSTIDIGTAHSVKKRMVDIRKTGFIPIVISPTSTYLASTPLEYRIQASLVAHEEGFTLVSSNAFNVPNAEKGSRFHLHCGQVSSKVNPGCRWKIIIRKVVVGGEEGWKCTEVHNQHNHSLQQVHEVVKEKGEAKKTTAVNEGGVEKRSKEKSRKILIQSPTSSSAKRQKLNPRSPPSTWLRNSESDNPISPSSPHSTIKFNFTPETKIYESNASTSKLPINSKPIMHSFSPSSPSPILISPLSLKPKLRKPIVLPRFPAGSSPFLPRLALFLHNLSPSLAQFTLFFFEEGIVNETSLVNLFGMSDTVLKSWMKNIGARSVEKKWLPNTSSILERKVKEVRLNLARRESQERQ